MSSEEIKFSELYIIKPNSVCKLCSELSDNIYEYEIGGRKETFNICNAKSCKFSYSILDVSEMSICLEITKDNATDVILRMFDREYYSEENYKSICRVIRGV